MAKKKPAKKKVAKKVAKKRAATSRRNAGVVHKPVFIAAICLNDKCKKVWFSHSNAIGMADGAKVTFVNSRTGPCPSCGGDGLIPDGEYTTVSMIMFRQEQFTYVAEAIRDLHDRILHGAKEDEVRKEISSNPVFTLLREYLLPKSYPEIISTLALVLTYVIWTHQSTPGTVLQLPQELSGALEAIARELPGIQSGIRKQSLSLQIEPPASRESNQFPFSIPCADN